MLFYMIYKALGNDLLTIKSVIHWFYTSNSVHSYLISCKKKNRKLELQAGGVELGGYGKFTRKGGSNESHQAALWEM